MHKRLGWVDPFVVNFPYQFIMVLPIQSCIGQHPMHFLQEYLIPTQISFYTIVNSKSSPVQSILETTFSHCRVFLNWNRKQPQVKYFKTSLPIHLSFQNKVLLPLPTSKTRLDLITLLTIASQASKVQIVDHGPLFRLSTFILICLSICILLHEHTIYFHRGHSSFANLHHHSKSNAIFLMTMFPTPNPPKCFGFWTIIHGTIGMPFPSSFLPQKNIHCSEIIFLVTTLVILNNLR